MKPVKFNYKNNSKNHIGFIAEEMIEGCERVVTYNA
jgi:hypothetical protein